LEAFQDLDVGCGSHTPELDTISPDRFEDGFRRINRVGTFQLFEPMMKNDALVCK
jgi:hypothetical protein